MAHVNGQLVFASASRLADVILSTHLAAPCLNSGWSLSFQEPAAASNRFYLAQSHHLFLSRFGEKHAATTLADQSVNFDHQLLGNNNMSAFCVHRYQNHQTGFSRPTRSSIRLCDFVKYAPLQVSPLLKSSGTSSQSGAGLHPAGRFPTGLPAAEQRASKSADSSEPTPSPRPWASAWALADDISLTCPPTQHRQRGHLYLALTARYRAADRHNRNRTLLHNSAYGKQRAVAA